MIPPEYVRDLSLLGHEPLCSHVAMYAESGFRSDTEKILSSFIKAMQENRHAASACRIWALYALDFDPDEWSLKVTDDGKVLFATFFQYQYKLYKGQKTGNFNEASEYLSSIIRCGISNIEPKSHRISAQRSARGRGSKARGKYQGNQRSSRPHRVLSPKNDYRRAEAGDWQGDISIRSGLGCDSDRAAGRTVTRQDLVDQAGNNRPQFKSGPALSHETTSVDFGEFLGPDVRTLRPPPRKVRRECLLNGEDTAVHGAPSGATSLEHADQILRDLASNALAVLQAGDKPDVQDWTQDMEEDVDCDDIDGHDQDETNDVVATVSPVATSKPPVPALPRIWAQSRQEVCESFEHFRSYHSGVYSKDDIVKGYLLGAYAASRDVFRHDGKLIISHGGGKSESILDPRRGSRRFQTDQDQEATDKSVRALLKTYRDRRPLVLLADDRYALFPYDLASGNYTYVVLGLYWISHAWAECQPSRNGMGRIVRWKFTFQWCEGQGDPWWASQQEMADVVALKPSAVTPDTILAKTGENSTMECASCQKQSPFIYQQGWMCLNPLCDVFWTLNGEEPNQLELVYREEFLTFLPRKFEKLPNITPVRAIETPSGVTTTYAFSKGWHCMECGRLSCRYKWEHWECANCGVEYVVNGRVRSPKEFWHQRPHKEFMHSRIGKDSDIFACRLEPIELGLRRGFTTRLTFILPHGRGKIHLILGTPLSNGDADEIFQRYQQQASAGELKLRRYPLRAHRARGLLLTNYFSQNSGEPYQYVGGTGNTVPFDTAPECVRRALAVIKERSNLALHADIPFNEVLSAAYMQRQKMAFHSDSERGLGPVVASLSLGSAALMHFRTHANAGDPKGKNSYALSLILRHGDVLIMEGEGVQKYYEHTVVPVNFRIAATARCIGSTT